jgi:hypothetical protein
MGGIAYAIGQVVSSRRKSVSDALAIALNEVAAIRLRADRFEEELHLQAQQMAELRAENITLRSLITGGEPVLHAIDRTRVELEEMARAEHEKTRAMIARIRNEEK